MSRLDDIADSILPLLLDTLTEKGQMANSAVVRGIVQTAYNIAKEHVKEGEKREANKKKE